VTHFGVTGWYDHYLVFSNSQPSFFVEERFSDADTPEWILYLGNKISQWQGGVDPEGLMESTFTAMGLKTQEFTSEQVTGTITDRTGSRAFDYIRRRSSKAEARWAMGRTSSGPPTESWRGSQRSTGSGRLSSSLRPAPARSRSISRPTSRTTSC